MWTRYMGGCTCRLACEAAQVIDSSDRDDRIGCFGADEDLEAAKEAFVGDILQQPPMFSAIKVCLQPKLL